MSDIDQTSAALGRIEAQIAAAATDHVEVKAEIRAARKEIHDLRDAVRALQAKVGDMEPEVKTLRALRNKGIGILAGVTLTAGVLGTLAWQGVRSLFAAP